jgi:uncharacterized damage-inducible protein DinB
VRRRRTRHITRLGRGIGDTQRDSQRQLLSLDCPFRVSPSYRVTLQDLRTLLDYHYWARDRLLDALEPVDADALTRDMGNSFRSIRDTLVHIYAAEWVWYMRWQGTSPTALIPGEQFPDLASLRREWTDLEQKVRAFVDALGDDGVNRKMDYTLFSGATGKSPFCHMLQHVVNHASYHRGQVTTMLRQIGAAPAKSMDLIAFYREQAQ